MASVNITACARTSEGVISQESLMLGTSPNVNFRNIIL